MNKKIHIFLKNNVRIIIFILIFFVLSYSIVFILHYLYYLDKFASYNNKPYNSNSKIFILIADEKYTDMSFLKENNIIKDCVLFMYDSEDGRYEVICADLEAVKWKSLNIQDIDFSSGSRVAVIGANVKKGIGNEIKVGEEKYIIKGILDRHISTSINYGIFYTKCSIDNVKTNMPYVLASSNDKSLKKAYKKICEQLLEKNVQIKEVQSYEAEIRDYINYSKSLKYMIVGSTIFYAFLVVVIFKLWLYVNRRYILVNELLGNYNVKIKVTIQIVCLMLVLDLAVMITYLNIHNQ